MVNDLNKAIVVNSVTKEFKIKNSSIVALQDVSLDIFEGEFVSIIGPSGCGKTTLMRMMANLESVTSGSISINGNSPNTARLNRDFSVVFQSPALLEWRNAINNVILPLETQKIKKSKAIIKAREMLEVVDLSKFEESFPRQLSGGMKQRISIARALTLDPSVLFMDEPFGALDRITREWMNMELLRIWQQKELTIVFITHNIQEAVMLSNRIVVMSSRPGQIQGIINVDLPSPRTLDLKETEEFIRIEIEGEKLLKQGMKYGN